MRERSLRPCPWKLDFKPYLSGPPASVTLLAGMLMMIHDASVPEKTVLDLPPVVFPNARVGARQHACSKPECQAARRKRTQAKWRAKNPEYATGYRIEQRSAQELTAEPLRLPPPLNQLPWDLAKDEFGSKGADFIGVMGALLVRSAKDQFRAYVADSGAFRPTSPFHRKRPDPVGPILNAGPQQSYGTGVSSTRSALGAFAGAAFGAAAAAAGIAGQSRATDSHRGGGCGRFGPIAM